jgi:hypothetical protein
VKVRAPFIWNVEVDSPSIERFDVSMATSFVHPSGIWASTSILFSDGGTSLTHQVNNAFTCGCAFEHIVTLYTRIIGFTNIINVFNNKIGFHL